MKNIKIVIDKKNKELYIKKQETVFRRRRFDGIYKRCSEKGRSSKINSI